MTANFEGRNAVGSGSMQSAERWVATRLGTPTAPSIAKLLVIKKLNVTASD
jgi:hypothetical protein